MESVIIIEISRDKGVFSKPTEITNVLYILEPGVTGAAKVHKKSPTWGPRHMIIQINLGFVYIIYALSPMYFKSWRQLRKPSNYIKYKMELYYTKYKMELYYTDMRDFFLKIFLLQIEHSQLEDLWQTG